MGQTPFSFTTNLQGARAYLTNEGDIPTGAYIGLCTGWDFPIETKAKDAHMLVLDITVQAGALLAPIPENAGIQAAELVGKTKKVYIIIPETCKNPNNVVHAQGNLKGWLMAFGLSAQEIDSPQFNMHQGLFLGKPCVFWNVQNTETVNGNVSALTPDQFMKIQKGEMHGPTKGKARAKRDGGDDADAGSASLMPSAGQSQNPMAGLGGGVAMQQQAPATVIPASIQAAPVATSTFPNMTPPNNGVVNPTPAAGGGFASILQHAQRS